MDILIKVTIETYGATTVAERSSLEVRAVEPSIADGTVRELAASQSVWLIGSAAREAAKCAHKKLSARYPDATIGCVEVSR